MRLAVLVMTFAVLAGLVACKNNGGSTPSSTPTPVPPISASPSSITLSLSGAGGVPQSITALTWTQQNATGDAGISQNCFPGSGTILASPTSTTQSVSGGVLTGSMGPITAAAVGTCQITLSPLGGGGATFVTVTVNS